QAADMFDPGFLDLTEELAGIRRQRFDIAALPLGEDRIQGERTLSRAAGSATYRHLVARQRDIDVLEVVLLRALAEQVSQMRRLLGANLGPPVGKMIAV